MKRIGFLMEKIVDDNNLREAIYSAAKNKKKTKAVIKIKEHPEEYIKAIKEMLLNDSYKPSELQIMVKIEPLSNKERIISKTPFYPDQIIHHALMQVLIPVLSRGMYKYCSANVPGRGTIYAKRACEKFIRRDPKNTKYFLKMDVKKFYPSINHDTLKAKLRRVIKDKKVLNLLDLIIDSSFPGLPIGTYTSQWLANFYLQDCDHYIKEKLHANYLVRYADDIVVLDSNKRKLRRIKQALDEYLDVKIKDTWIIGRVTDNRFLDFVGYRIYRRKTAIRRRIFKRIRRLIIHIINRAQNHIKIAVKQIRSFFSYYGYIVNSDSYYIKHHYLSEINLYQLKKSL